MKQPTFKGFVLRERKAGNFLVFAGKELLWEKITNELLYEYRDWLESCGYAQNSRRAFMAEVKQVLDKANSLGYDFPASGYSDILKCKPAPTLNVYLTMEEIKKLESIYFEHPKAEAARVRFLIGCYTGARFSDYSKLKESNIIESDYVDCEGNLLKAKHIQYVSIKTGTLCQVPLKKEALELIRENIEEITVNDMNKFLPEICKQAGIESIVDVIKGDKRLSGRKYSFVSSHTARRTFANNLYILGVPIETIAKYLGHSSPDVTLKNYISCPLRINEIALNRYFGI